MTTDDPVPRKSVAKKIEALADDPTLAENYLPGSEGETAYVHAIQDAVDTVCEYPDGC